MTRPRGCAVAATKEHSKFQIVPYDRHGREFRLQFRKVAKTEALVSCFGNCEAATHSAQWDSKV